MITKNIFFCSALLFTTLASAQDIIFKTNGDELQVKVLKVSQTEVEYNKWNRQDGPVYTLPVRDIFMIKYSDGEKEIFSNTNSTSLSEDNKSQSKVKTNADSRNAGIINTYNNTDLRFKTKKERKNYKEASFFTGVLGVTENSVFSSDDITIKISQSPEGPFTNYPKGKILDWSPSSAFWGHYDIEVINNTDNDIYVDKGNSFKILPDGTYLPFFSGNVSTVSEGSATSTGVGVGILGIGIGAGSSNSSSVSTTYSDDRYVIIPPHGKTYLAKDMIETLKNGRNYMITMKAEYPGNQEVPEPMILGLKEGERRDFDSTDNATRYVIKYSKDKDFKTSSEQEIGVYLKHIMGQRDNILDQITGYQCVDTFEKFCEHYVATPDPNAIIVIYREIPKEIRNRSKEIIKKRP